MQKRKRRSAVRYRIDNAFSAGTGPLVLWLAVITLALILLAGFVIAVFHVTINGSGHTGFAEAVWQSMLRTIDSGTMSGDNGWGWRVLSLFITLGGIFVVSTLIGLLAAGIETKLASLRRGRTHVVERGHTLILGWSPKIYGIVSELAIANANQRDACIVVIADRDKTDMEEDLRGRVEVQRPTRLVFRTGEPSDPGHLDIGNPIEAKSIVILCPEDGTGDAQVIRAVLALLNLEALPSTVPILAELNDGRSARALRRTTDRRVQTVVSSEVIARITAQVCRQQGLSAVYQELLDFDGDEIYFQEEPALVGHAFADALVAYEDSALIGICDAAGKVTLCPPMNTRIEPGDRVVAISADDDTVVCAGVGEPMTLPASASAAAAPPDAVEHILVMGWSPLGPLLLRELDYYVGPGSTARVVVDPGLVSADTVEQSVSLRNLELAVIAIDAREPIMLAAVLDDHPVDHIIMLCYRDGMTEVESDASALLALLQVRHTLDRWEPGRARPSVVAEMLDVRDVELARVTEPDDFVVSERLTSLLLAQLAENPRLDDVFRDLFDPDGAEISLRDAGRYVGLDREMSFADAVRAGIEQGDVVIGYRLVGRVTERDLGGGVVLNARKSSRLTFNPGDQLVVVATNNRLAQLSSR